jgi:hypothetical protein
VRTNERGTTRPLSFRDIARLVIIDEETVIKEDSPVLSGQVIHKTVESGVFRLLLTGTDDSSDHREGRSEGREGTPGWQGRAARRPAEGDRGAPRRAW